MKRKEYIIILVIIVVCSFVSYGINKLLTMELVENSNSSNAYRNLALISEDGLSQTVAISILKGSYDDITIYKDIPVVWEIDVPEGELSDCNHEFLCQDFNLDVTLKEGKNIVEFTPSSTGTYEFSCWMDMIHNNITVIEK